MCLLGLHFLGTWNMDKARQARQVNASPLKIAMVGTTRVGIISLVTTFRSRLISMIPDPGLVTHDS